MVEVKLIGHNNYYGLSDVLRLYFTYIKEDQNNQNVYSENGPDIQITSEVNDDKVITSCGDITIVKDASEIGIKREVKRSLYELLAQITDTTYPWGCLTGIRPTLVANELDTPQQMHDLYHVRIDKAKLAFDTAKRENELLEGIPEESLNMYIGVPFCPTRCEYCSFVAQEISHHLKLLGEYASALEKEIKRIGESLKSPLASVYMGGGTPTVFNEEDMTRVLKAIRCYLPMDANTEFTVEAGRPDTITTAKLCAMKEAGVNRICINPQTMNSETLSKLNRRHSAEDTIRVYKEAKALGFEVINMDLIAGLKYENATELIKSLNTILELDPENITIHTLYKKRNSNMSKDSVLDMTKERGDLDGVIREAYDILYKAGYEPYYMYRQKDTGHGLENVGFCKPGTCNKYNVAMMSDKRNVISIGAGGMSKRIFDGGRLERCPTIKDVSSYIRQVDDIAIKKIDFYNLNNVK